jgi:peptidoglycan/xylan/chitin deacetylase (PgdA/CDA1 family)
MLFAKTPVLLMKLFPELIWHFSRRDEQNKHIYLTFDDGPTPEVTPWVLEQLHKYKAKATFFCLGRNVDRYPEIFQQILDEGHIVGNHTYSHLKGWRTKNSEYLKDIDLAGETIKSRLYRPPYGRFKKSQIREIRKDYHIVMWDVLSQDYDSGITPQKCLDNVLRNVRSGSIVVFHDSVKAKKNLYYALPALLKKFSGEYEFLPIRQAEGSKRPRHTQAAGEPKLAY